MITETEVVITSLLEIVSAVGLDETVNGFPDIFENKELLTGDVDVFGITVSRVVEKVTVADGVLLDFKYYVAASPLDVA